MPLDDREQRILAEIERQLYAEDPALVHAVKNIDRSGRFGVRLPLVGVIVGLVVTIATFTVSPYIALAGFVVLVASATALVHGLRSRVDTADRGDGPGWVERFRRR